MEATVLLGDVVESREIEDRERFANDASDAVEAINDAFGEYLSPNFTVLKGVDEFVGVLDSVAPLYRIVDLFNQRVHPVEARFVAVTGDIDVVGDDASELDGPAFHRADETIRHLAEQDLFYDVYGGDELVDVLVAGQMNLLHMLKRRWTERQRDIIAQYRRRGTQTGVAEALGIKQQTVSDTLKTAEWQRIHQLEDTLNGALEHYADRGTR